MKTGGEDAAFHGPKYLAVADGVGGWSRVGVDSGKYSRELLSHANETLMNFPQDEVPQPVNVLQDAFSKTKAMGSTTVCFAFLDPSKRSISFANLGDSGYLLYNTKSRKILARSEELLHSFNFPFQLGSGSSDLPEQSTLCTMEVEHDDVLILGTDGLWDNMFDHEIVEILDELTGKSAKEITQKLVVRTFRASLDYKRKSPFWERSGLKGKVGGKPDDITILVAKVKDPLAEEKDGAAAMKAKANVENGEEGRKEALHNDEKSVG